MNLKLVTTTRPHDDHDHDDGAVDVELRVFEAWRELLRHGVPTARTLSPQRRALLSSSSSSFDVEVMLLAVEGCAASAWCQGRNRTGQRFDSLEWIFGGGEARVERLAELGLKARRMLAEQQRMQQAPAVPPEDPARKQAALERLRVLRQQLAGIAAAGGVR